MKERILRLLKKHSESETNLNSESARELLTTEILNIVDPPFDHTDEWRIEQYNRNRTPEDQVKTINEMEAAINKLFIYESPDDGKTIYRRKFGDYDNRKLIKD